MTDARITVDFRYICHGTSAWSCLPIEPRDYFDLSVNEPGEGVDIHCVPEHLDPRHFLPEDPAAIRNIEVVIRDEDTGFERRETHTYWRHGTCVAIERSSTVPGSDSYSLTVQQTIDDSPKQVTTVQFGRIDGALVTTSISRNDDDQLHPEKLADVERVDLYQFLNPWSADEE